MKSSSFAVAAFGLALAILPASVVSQDCMCPCTCAPGKDVMTTAITDISKAAVSLGSIVKTQTGSSSPELSKLAVAEIALYHKIANASSIARAQPVKTFSSMRVSQMITQLATLDMVFTTLSSDYLQKSSLWNGRDGQAFLPLLGFFSFSIAPNISAYGSEVLRRMPTATAATFQSEISALNSACTGIAKITSHT